MITLPKLSFRVTGSFLTSSNTTNVVLNTPTKTTITRTAPNPSLMGQAVTIDFTVVPIAPGSGTPGGNVMVSDGVGDSCTAAAASGNCSISFAAAGTKTLTASYAGEGNFNSSASAGAAQTVMGFSISATPTQETIGAGNTAVYVVRLTSVLGFTGHVTLSCGALPPDSSCSIVPSSGSLGPSGGFSAVVSIQTSSHTPAGTYYPMIIGEFGTGIPATGGATSSTTVTLTVR